VDGPLTSIADREAIVETIVERCAGLDVHKDMVTACLRTPAPGGGRRQQIGEFRTDTAAPSAALSTARAWFAVVGGHPDETISARQSRTRAGPQVAQSDAGQIGGDPPVQHAGALETCRARPGDRVAFEPPR
jgi:hypothetical protein